MATPYGTFIVSFCAGSGLALGMCFVINMNSSVINAAVNADHDKNRKICGEIVREVTAKGGRFFRISVKKMSSCQSHAAHMATSSNAEGDATSFESLFRKCLNESD